MSSRAPLSIFICKFLTTEISFLPFALSVDHYGRVRLTGVSLPFLTVHTLSGVVGGCQL